MKRKVDFNKMISNTEKRVRELRTEIKDLKARIADLQESNPDSPYIKALQKTLKDRRSGLLTDLNIIKTAKECIEMGNFINEQESKGLIVSWVKKEPASV